MSDDRERLDKWLERADDRDEKARADQAAAKTGNGPGRTFAARLGATVREPLAWVGAAGVGAASWKLDGAAEWLAGAIAHVLPLDTVVRLGLYPRTPGALPAYLAHGDLPEMLRWLGLTIAASLVGVLVTAATLGAGRRKGAAALLQVGWWRVLRTRMTLLLPVGMVGGIAAAALNAGHRKLGVVTDVGLAVILALAGGWAVLADRFALSRFDTKQDKHSWDAWQANRHMPNYHNSAAPRGYGVADGADMAVTAAGKVLFTAVGLRTVALTLALAMPVAVVEPALRIVLAAAVALVSAQLWTDVFTFGGRPPKPPRELARATARERT